MQIDPASLREFRLSLNLSQAGMAMLLNTPLASYKNWEQGRTSPPGCLAVALEWLNGESDIQPLRERIKQLEADLEGAWRDYDYVIGRE